MRWLGVRVPSPAQRPSGRVRRAPPGRGRRRGGVPERPKGADCKSAGSRLRRFESFPLHQLSNARLYAGIAQRLEHRPSKPRVAGSNPVSRSIIRSVNLLPGQRFTVAWGAVGASQGWIPCRPRKSNNYPSFALTAEAPGPRFPDSRDTPRRPPIEEVAFGVVCLFQAHPGCNSPPASAGPSLLTFRIRATLSAGMVAVVRAHVAQSVEHLHGKEKVTGSIPVVGSICTRVDPPKQVMRRSPGR